MSHNSKLPDDVVTPVLPPILPSPSFELPRIQRVQRSSSLDNQSTSQGPVSNDGIKCKFNQLMFKLSCIFFPCK